MRTLDARICYATPFGTLICGRCLLNQDPDSTMDLEATDSPASMCALDPCLTKENVRPFPPAEDPLPGSEAGQSLVEFAVVLPLFVLVLILITDGAGILWRFNAAASLAQRVCREASIHGPAAAQAGAAGYSAAYGSPSTITAAYVTSARHDVRATVATPNRALLFGRGLVIRAEAVAHVEQVAP